MLQALLILLAATSILLVFISLVIPTLCNFLIIGLSIREYLANSIWFVITLVLRCNPLHSHEVMWDLYGVKSTGRGTLSISVSRHSIAASERRLKLLLSKLKLEHLASLLKSSLVRQEGVMEGVPLLGQELGK